MTLAEEVARTVGDELRIVDANDSHIIPCIACGSCARDGRCVLDHRDDMSPIREALRTADRLILASPIHFSSVSAPLVTLFSRLQPEWHAFSNPDRVPRTPRPKAVLVLTAGGLYPNMFEPARIVAAAVFRTLDFENAGTVAAAETDTVPVSENADILAKARGLGKIL